MRQENAKDVANVLRFAPSSNSCPLAAGQGLNEEKVSVTLSAFLLSVLSGNTPHAQVADSRLRRHAHSTNSAATREEEDLQRCKIYRKSFPMTEIALPATALEEPFDREVGEGSPRDG